ncbi:MAG: alpha/beta fold hydrolase [Chlorobi bacterium]|nr:alpha/beta fold hydrolase [Chlorobiota bacterium]
MKLFYREYGKGEPIIITHGLFGMSDNWIPIAKKLAENFKVYLPDMRNHGNSPHSEIHTYDAMSNDILEFIEDRNIKNAIFAGHSMGGKAVLQFAEKFPERVTKMIIIDISPEKYIPDEKFFKKALNHKLLLEKLKTVNLELPDNRKELNELITLEFQNPFISQLILKNIRKNNERFYWKINIAALYKHLYEMQRKIKLTEKVKDIKTLFIFGGNSPYFNKNDKVYIKTVLPKSEIKIIPDVGHLIHIENENELIKRIFSFTD